MCQSIDQDTLSALFEATANLNRKKHKAQKTWALFDQ